MVNLDLLKEKWSHLPKDEQLALSKDWRDALCDFNQLFPDIVMLSNGRSLTDDETRQLLSIGAALSGSLQCTLILLGLEND